VWRRIPFHDRGARSCEQFDQQHIVGRPNNRFLFYIAQSFQALLDDFRLSGKIT
jgi:hypothetical protein